MKHQHYILSALAASLLLGTSIVASAQTDSNSMKSDDSTMQSDDSMSSGDMKSDDKMMKSDDKMGSDDKMMKSDDKMGSDDSMSKDSVMVGGAPMYPNKTVVENASQAKNLTTLVAAVKQAGLVDTLSGPGPFTVFAPTNKAFGKLPKSAVDSLMKPAGKDKLTKILTYHVVPGKLTAADLKQKIADNNGKPINLTTVEGEVLSVAEDQGKLVLLDKKGHGTVVQQADVMQSNGVAHVIGSVLMP